MIQKGSMLILKKILGVILMLYAINIFYTIPVIGNYIIQYNSIIAILIGVAGYFLWISGRQI